VDEVEVDVKKVTTYFNSKVTASSINTELSFLAPFIISQLNLQLSKGIEIPVNQNLKDFVTKEEILIMDKMLIFQGGANVSKRDKK
jgi:hypothetical protein